MKRSTPTSVIFDAAELHKRVPYRYLLYSSSRRDLCIAFLRCLLLYMMFVAVVVRPCMVSSSKLTPTNNIKHRKPTFITQVSIIGGSPKQEGMKKSFLYEQLACFAYLLLCWISDPWSRFPNVDSNTLCPSSRVRLEICCVSTSR